MRIRNFFATLGLVLGLAGSGQAADLYNTLPATNRGDDFINAGTPNLRLAQSFSTTANDYILSSVTLSMFMGVLNSPGTFGVELYGFNTNDSKPTTLVTGGSIYSGNSSILSTSATDVVFSGLNITLVPSTQYYIVINANLNHALFWQYAKYPSGSGSTGYSTQYYTSSSDSGSSWSSSTLSTTYPYIMKITAVPEPSTWALAGLATGVIGFIARHRNAKRKG